ncbi:MAG TPA: hypothetical protein PKE12_05200 [Kiritimatiellia bacterium]|nr:hypothetical protein [Kiritimatiellia bacterium]
MKNWSAFIFAAFGMAAVTACDRAGDTQLRRYREISVPAATRTERAADVAAMAQAQPATPPAGPVSDMNAPGAPAVAAAPVSVQWTTPAGWIEQPGNPMRIMTFVVGPNRVECTLTAFPGTVGGIEGNLQRWAGQINLNLAPEVIARFARTPKTFKTEGDFSCLVYDFADVAPGAEPSTLAAILPLDDRTIFVKFTGPGALLAAEKEAFEALCRSLRP